MCLWFMLVNGWPLWAKIVAWLLPVVMLMAAIWWLEH